MRRLLYLAAFLTLAGWAIAPEAFVVNPKNAKWPSFPISYRINGSNADMTSNEAIADIQAAAAVWEASGSTVDLTYAGTSAVTAAAYDGTNVVFFSSGSNGSLGAMTSWWNSGTTILQFDIAIYDGAYLFLKNDASCTGSKLFLLDTVTHEFGHVLGLTHSLDTTATMRPSMAYCTSTMRDLAQDDINGINFLYPPGSPNPSTPTAPTGLTVASASSSSLTVGWTDASSDESGFSIQTSRDNTTWTTSGTVGAGVTSTTLTGLMPSTLYYVRVGAFNTNGFSAYTAAGSATTDPTQAQGITLELARSKRKGQRYVTLRWTAVTPAAVDVYRNNAKITTTSASAGDYTDSLSGPGTFVYQVCEQSTSTCSNTATAIF